MSDIADNADDGDDGPGEREHGQDYRDGGNGGNVTGDYQYWSQGHWNSGRCQPKWNGFRWVYPNKWWCRGRQGGTLLNILTTEMNFIVDNKTPLE